MQFDIVSIFPEACESYLDASILKRAQEAGLVKIALHNLRNWTNDRHQTTDDTPYGGGAGMVMKVEPFALCLDDLLARSEVPREKTRIILLSAKGKRFTQSRAAILRQYERIIFLCGRYEGVDERVAEHLADEELSIGEFVLTGGELPAMVITDAITRLIPGVLGNATSPVNESFSEEGKLEYPQYTKPEVYRGWHVPKVLLSGHHAEIVEWRKTQTKELPLKREE